MVGLHGLRATILRSDEDTRPHTCSLGAQRSPALWDVRPHCSFLALPPLFLPCSACAIPCPPLPSLAFSPPPFFPASPVCSFALCVSLRSWLRCPDWAASLCPLPSLPCSYAPMVAPWSGTTQSYTPGVVDTGHAGDVARRQAVAILRN